jgi:small-conductance mechanosensitive channel
MKRSLPCCLLLLLSFILPAAAAQPDAGKAETLPRLVRSDPSFADPAFFAQFNRELAGATLNGLRQALRTDPLFWRSQGWIMVLQLLLALAVALAIRARRTQLAEISEWRFALCHPLAGGLFIATLGLLPLYHDPPDLWLLLQSGLIVFSAAVLMSELLSDRLQARWIVLLGAVFVLSRALQAISLPHPLYRLYLALLCLAGMPVLLRLANRAKQAPGGKQAGARGLLLLGAAILGLAFLAQGAGYSGAAARLLEASLATVFLVLCAIMLRRLGHGGLAFLLRRGSIRKWPLIRRHGPELLHGLRQLLSVVIAGGAFFYLLVVWGLFDSFGKAWQAIFQAGFTWNNRLVSMKTLLLGLGVLYGAVTGSWLLRSVLDEEVFPRHHVDRGVRDSIKKLLHYALLSLGVLLALSVTGIDLKNFAVLAGALGIGIGFGLQNIVNNFVSGLILLFERPIKVGDMVMLDGDWGTVRKIGLRSTTVETFDQSEIIVPNSILVSEKVTNWTLSSEQSRIVVPVGVAYGSDVERVLAVLLEAGRQHPEVLDDPAPSPIFTAFGDSSLDFELRVWTRDVDKRLIIKNDLLLHIDRRFREENIEIPFPQHDLHLRSVDTRILNRARPEKPSPADGQGPQRPS